MNSSGSLEDVFSFDTPEAVLRVLASIRASAATIEQKNELRDLVLSYTNGGKDPSVQIQISQRLQSFGVALVPAPPTPMKPMIHDFGSARKVPTFAPSKATQAATAPSPTPTAKPVAEPTPTSVSFEPVAYSTPPTVPPITVESPATVSSAQTIEPVAPVSITTTPTPPTEPIPVTATSASPSVAPEADETLNRIRQIKSQVNLKIGNPVNLVDINNAVGREYMSALLDAMKQLNSGTDPAPAMNRLEAAYQAVEEVLKTNGTQPSQPQPNSVLGSRPLAVPQAVATEIATQPVTPVEAIETPTTIPVAPVPELNSQPVPTETEAQDDRWVASKPHPASSTPVISTPATPSAPVKVVPLAAFVPHPTPVPPSTPTVRSLNDSATPLKTINDVPTAASINSSETGDPLFTKEVTNGLNQLLSDWSLFKKSGLFGTGPKGIEHPLYAKVKDLQIPLLLAGRFEGATQEIKQSVTDYMNGWRYEQGIIYELGEIFDHYLRRVIRHILDLQK